ncbi:uncharacterized protein LOC132196068 [Neocloeon triangulifer]|uniref:uncharacterized protein LOC132196068 n=1 Tax=Neocloeon triangulifer TaxID=2078957 RepID=UPI00286F0244|nr:uncharacterized protein LOC132196068 [Neocloeon triangulifer]
MQSITLILLLCTLRTDFVLSQSDDSTDCAKLDFKKIPATCCKTPFGNVLDTKLMSDIKSCKPSAKLLEWGNSYKMNVIQSKSMQNFPDNSSSAFTKDACAAAVFMNCVFAANSWVSADGSINVATFTEYLLSVTSSTTWKGIVSKMLNPLDSTMAASYPFTDIVEDNFESATCSKSKVNLLPLIFVQMIQSELVWMCPQQNVYSIKNKCEETMYNFQYCDGKIYDSSAKGIFYFAV